MFESHHVSRHFERRRYQRHLKSRRKTNWARVNRQRSRTAKRLPKLSLAVHAASHLILAARATTGLGNDHPYFVPLLRQASSSRLPLGLVVADAGYDSESNHRAARQDLKIRSLIPATCGRPGKVKGYYRRLMRRQWKRGVDRRRYRQRSQAETTNSMMKRNLGSACRSRTTLGRKRDLLIRIVTHNLMIVANL